MKKCRTGLLFIILLMFASLFFAYNASAMESTCPSSVMATAMLARGETELTIYCDTNKTEKSGKLEKGVTCQVLGASGDYYRISFNGIDGYARKNKLNLKGIASDTAYTGHIVTDVALEQYLFSSISQSKTMAIHGSIQAEEPLDTLFFSCGMNGCKRWSTWL